MATPQLIFRSSFPRVPKSANKANISEDRNCRAKKGPAFETRLDIEPKIQQRMEVDKPEGPLHNAEVMNLLRDLNQRNKDELILMVAQPLSDMGEQLHTLYNNQCVLNEILYKNKEDLVRRIDDLSEKLDAANTRANTLEVDHKKQNKKYFAYSFVATVLCGVASLVGLYTPHRDKPVDPVSIQQKQKLSPAKDLTTVTMAPSKDTTGTSSLRPELQVVAKPQGLSPHS